MHYNQYAFSKNLGDISIIPLDTNVKGDDLGQRQGFTETDSAQVRAAYVSGFLKCLPDFCHKSQSRCIVCLARFPDFCRKSRYPCIRF